MIHVIIGAPCSGKSTYVKEHAQDGDLCVDYDEIAKSIGSSASHMATGHVRKAAFAARDALIDYAIANSEDCDSWIIHTSPQNRLDEYKSVNAELIVMDTDRETCLARAESDGRPEGTAEIINAYFSDEKRGNMTLYKNAPSATETDGGTVKGYASTFDREPDAYGDVIAKGAFLKSIERWAKLDKPIPLLYGHNTDDPEYNIGKVTEIHEDEKGLYIEAEFDAENQKAQYVRKLVQEGRLFQFSFAFDCTKWREVELDDGTKANELQELDIYEVSLVQIPANQHAEVVEVKSGRRNSKADESELMRIYELCADIQSIIYGLTEKPDEEPDGEEANAEEETNAEEPKPEKALIDEANKILNTKE